MSRFLAFAAMALLPCLIPQAVCAGPRSGDSQLSRPPFRLGSAATPFGDATVVADFDADGAPDVAIADRTDRTGGSNYRIEVHLSDGRTQSVSFVSAARALNITAVDIDDDHDPDLVVSPVLSRKIVGVWLNDGAGHFARLRNTSVFPARTPQIDGVTLNGLPNHIQATVTSARRLIGLAASPRAAPRLDASAAPTRTIVPAVYQRTLSLSSPRAPPSHC